MGRLIVVVTLMLNAGIALAGGVPQGVPQQHMDAIREHHTKRILGSSQELTILQPDVTLYRKIFSGEVALQYSKRPLKVDEAPSVQVFKSADLKLGPLVRLLSAAGGYDASFHPQVNQEQYVKLNTQANSLTEIAEYLTRVTDAQFTTYPESRLLVAMPKGAQQ